MKKGTFIKKFIITVVILAVIGSALFLLQRFYGIFDKPLHGLGQYLSMMDKVVLEECLTGVSVGTIIAALLLLILPVFTRNIDTRSYFKNIYQGIISSFIFYLTNIAYSFIEKINKLYLFLSIMAVVIVTFILIQIMARMFRKDKGVEFRTNVISSITAGLIFGVLLKLISLGVDLVKVKYHFM